MRAYVCSCAHERVYVWLSLHGKAGHLSLSYQLGFECAVWSRAHVRKGGLPPATHVCHNVSVLLRGGTRVLRYLDGKSDELYEPAKDTGLRLGLPLGACGEQTVGFFHLHRDNVDWVFVDHPSYHRAGNPYGDQHGVFGDNQFRYALLSMAACEAPLQLPIGGYRCASSHVTCLPWPSASALCHLHMASMWPLRRLVLPWAPGRRVQVERY